MALAWDHSSETGTRSGPAGRARPVRDRDRRAGLGAARWQRPADGAARRGVRPGRAAGAALAGAVGRAGLSPAAPARAARASGSCPCWCAAVR